MSVREQIKHQSIPEHIAIIMDGNGRWAKEKGYPRAIGHKNGVDTLGKIASASAEIGIKFLTVYVFSSENWQRPHDEVNTLMSLLASSLKEKLRTLMDNDISLNVIGNTHSLPDKCYRELKKVIYKTTDNKHMILTIALSYSSKEEIVEATRDIAKEVKEGNISLDDIDENLFEKYLYTKNMSYPDLLIRTGGEYRVSNYLLWQIAYSELYFTAKLWPDFNEEDLYKAILDYQRRERRFGKISEQLN